MKRCSLLFGVLVCFLLHNNCLWAQQDTSIFVREDSLTITRGDKASKKIKVKRKAEVIWSKKPLLLRDQHDEGHNHTDDSEHHHETHVEYDDASGVFYGGIVFSRVDVGLATMIDNGSFNLAPENSFLATRTWKSTNFGFDVLQLGFKVNPKFKIYLSGGLDWTYYRIQKDILFVEDAPALSFLEPDDHFRKNRFTSAYLRIPLALENKISNAKVAYGLTGDFLLRGTQKTKGGNEGTVKRLNDFNFNKFRYGAFARITYSNIGVFAKYYFNDLFENSPEVSGIKNFSFGLTLNW